MGRYFDPETDKIEIKKTHTGKFQIWWKNEVYNSYLKIFCSTSSRVSDETFYATAEEAQKESEEVVKLYMEPDVVYELTVTHLEDTPRPEGNIFNGAVVRENVICEDSTVEPYEKKEPEEKNRLRDRYPLLSLFVKKD